MRRLPTYYYLTHFHEFLQFVEGPCADLLHPEHEAFLNSFHQASKDQQCALVRCINRKFKAVKISSLRFEELPHIRHLIGELSDMGWLASPNIQSMQQVFTSERPRMRQFIEDRQSLELILECLTKDELYTLCTETNKEHNTLQTPVLKKSLPKAHMLEACLSADTQALLSHPLCQDMVLRCVDPFIDYFLFLYFGNTKSRLNQFSLRDLGIMNTREEQAQMRSRFGCKHTALMSFRLSKFLSSVRYCINHDSLNTPAKLLELWDAIPDISSLNAKGESLDANLADKHAFVQFELAKAILAFDEDGKLGALDKLHNIELEQAQEKWCREAYKAGFKDEVKDKLTRIIDDPISDKILTFAEDFLARKYKQKRTSVLTDMLREHNQHLSLDEVFKGGVERGVIAYYNTRAQDKSAKIQAIRSENVLWRSLFGLTLWQELFDLPGLGLSTQFDFMPNCLKQNNFYRAAKKHIDAKLSAISSAHDLMRLLTQNAATHFGKGQGIFNWRSDLLENLSLFVNHAPIKGIKAQLLRMSKDWQACHDGFPDIMVVENNQLRFEEIKGEGDVLRRNQLTCIRALREAGFDVRITTVDFIIDPKQPYVVVDIETTGGRASNHKITEIGMVKMVGGEIVDSWQSLLNPQRRIPSNITALTGISDDMVRGAPLFSDIADEVDAFTEGCIFVAHNVNFDYGFIKEEFARLERFWRRPKLCTVQQMRKHYKGLASYSLANLTKHFGIEMQRHHRAMSDAVAAGELLKLINEKRFAS